MTDINYYVYFSSAYNFFARYLQHYLQHCKAVDKVQIVLYFTWCMAWCGLQLAKISSMFFKLILMMPDSWIPQVQHNPSNIKIITASDGNKDITNKLKLFLKYYWENDESCVHADGSASGGFNFNKYRDLLNCSILYCSYLLTDKNGTISPGKFWENVNRFLVTTQNENVIRYTNSELTNPEIMPFGTVNFHMNNNEHQQERINRMNEITDIINSFEKTACT